MPLYSPRLMRECLFVAAKTFTTRHIDASLENLKRCDDKVWSTRGTNTGHVYQSSMAFLAQWPSARSSTSFLPTTASASLQPRPLICPLCKCKILMQQLINLRGVSSFGCVLHNGVGWCCRMCSWYARLYYRFQSCRMSGTSIWSFMVLEDLNNYRRDVSIEIDCRAVSALQGRI